MPQPSPGVHAYYAAPLATDAPLREEEEDVPTRDENGRKLPRWKIKRSVCGICNKRFESRHKLRLHTYSHTGERPHECEVCGMRFSRNFCYRRHLKTHTDVKPHQCSRCGRGFREKYDMETHMMTEVCLKARQGRSPRPHCAACDASFASAKALSAHRQQAHPQPDGQVACEPPAILGI